MEVEKEIRKKPTTGRGRKGALKGRALTTRRAVRPRPPTKKAIKAAVSAMTNAGFSVPDGMKVVINLEKDDSKPKQKSNANDKRKSNKGDHPNKNNGGRLWGKKK